MRSVYHRSGHCFYGDGFHAAEVNRAFAQKAWGALDVLAQDGVIFAQWASPYGFG